MFKILFCTQTFQFFLTCLIYHNETIEFDQQNTFLFPTTIYFSIGFLTSVINLPNKTEAINSNLGNCDLLLTLHDSSLTTKLLSSQDYIKPEHTQLHNTPFQNYHKNHGAEQNCARSRARDG